VVAYNSPKVMLVERELRALSRADSRLILLKVRGGKTKAENFNAALDVITTPFVGFFDADSQPCADCLDRACFWLENGFDFVQGANSIQWRAGAGVLGFLVATEYLLKYHVSYVGRYRSLGVTYFTGSNGYWRTEVLRELRAKEVAQVEDIEMSIRALMAGRVLAYDPAISAMEQAPPSWSAWWHQRVRWAQGWAQLLKWYQSGILRSRLNFATKCVWTFFLCGRRLLVPAALLAVLGGCLVQILADVPATGYELASFGGLLAIQVTATGASLAVLIRSSLLNHFEVRSLALLVFYAIVFPLYDAARDLTVLRGSLALIRDPASWRVTPRAENHGGTRPEPRRWSRPISPGSWLTARCSPRR
jgi:cellulose synthase/poly-beta-1,6-N-acetylglucosamine synthase-like glycosyltransferase